MVDPKHPHAWITVGATLTGLGGGSLTGTDINESTLVLTCPAAMTRLGDFCYGGDPTDAALITALLDCRDQGLRLASLSEGLLIAKEVGGQLWVDSGTHFDLGQFRGTYAMSNAFQQDNISANLDYRCVTTVGARP